MYGPRANGYTFTSAASTPDAAASKGGLRPPRALLLARFERPPQTSARKSNSVNEGATAPMSAADGLESHGKRASLLVSGQRRAKHGATNP